MPKHVTTKHMVSDALLEVSATPHGPLQGSGTAHWLKVLFVGGRPVARIYKDLLSDGSI